MNTYELYHLLVTQVSKQNVDTTTPQSRFQLTTAAPITTTENENCKPYNPPMPNFRTPNRRISEVSTYLQLSVIYLSLKILRTCDLWLEARLFL